MSHYNLTFRNLVFFLTLFVFFLYGCESQESIDSRFNAEYSLALSSYENKEFQDCLLYCDKALEIIDNSEQVFALKSFAYYQMAMYSDGLEQANKAIKLKDNKSYGYKPKAFNLEKLERKDEALENAQKYYKVYSNDLEVSYLIAKLNYDLGKLKQAVIFYSKCIEFEYNVIESKIARGLAYKELGEIQLSLVDFESMNSISDLRYQNKINLILGELKIEQNNLNDALFHIRKTDTIQTNKLIGLIYDKMQIKDSAVYYYNTYLNRFNSYDSAVKLRLIELDSDKYSFFEKSKVNYDLIHDDWKSSGKDVYRTSFLVVTLFQLLFWVFIPYLNKRKISSKKRMYDNYSASEALFLAKFRFCLGGSWLYTFKGGKNEKRYYLNNYNIEIFALLSFILYFFRLIYLYQLNLSVYIHDYYNIFLVFVSLLTFLVLYYLDISTCEKRINELNVSFRKSLGTEEIIEREEKANDLEISVEEAVSRLKNNISNLKNTGRWG